jgi:hypothetical protein
MIAIHPNARTTPARRSPARVSHQGVLACRFGVSSETLRKWRKRGTSTLSFLICLVRWVIVRTVLLER